MERADDGALEQPECALHSVRVNVTAHVFFGGMDDRLVQSFVAGIVVQPLTARMLVGVDMLNVRRTVALAAAGEPERAAPAIIQADALPSRMPWCAVTA
jgi:hypothetical protein